MRSLLYYSIEFGWEAKNKQILIKFRWLCTIYISIFVVCVRVFFSLSLALYWIQKNHAGWSCARHRMHIAHTQSADSGGGEEVQSKMKCLNSARRTTATKAAAASNKPYRFFRLYNILFGVAALMTGSGCVSIIASAVRVTAAMHPINSCLQRVY